MNSYPLKTIRKANNLLFFIFCWLDPLLMKYTSLLKNKKKGILKRKKENTIIMDMQTSRQDEPKLWCVHFE